VEGLEPCFQIQAQEDDRRHGSDPVINKGGLKKIEILRTRIMVAFMRIVQFLDNQIF
jgi:hypothetical protein